ncbi:Sec-independent protein translocase subunit TatA [Leifsonia sp. AG29]|uniref:Sec-independent protein translocase subunit TatA n=1 Tax=Leifsonia sp. AG29 TaxID=2598860 RepID=UPI00131B902A|nr:Sec-independent protein translocase subunit TatA [Leifsonia sp. AG29]
MFAGLTGWHLLIILAVILLLFGAPKLPALAKSIGQSMRIFKGEVEEMKKDGKETPETSATAPATPADTAVTPAPAPAVTDPATESKPKP